MPHRRHERPPALTLVAPFIADAICSLLRNVCIRKDTAWSWTRICVNFWTYRRVRTRSLARILHALYDRRVSRTRALLGDAE